MRGWRSLIFGLAAVSASVAGGTEPAAQDKTLVVYSANEKTLEEVVFPAFQKETGIEVQLVSAGSGVLLKRVTTEKDRPQGDVVWGLSRQLLETHKAYFRPYRSKNRDAIPAEYRDPDDVWIGNNLHVLVILQNTKLVPEAEGPKGWSDLLDPKWKGKIAFTDPANSGSAFANSTMLVDLFGGGDAGWSKVTQLYGNMKVLNRSSLVFQGVGNGEYPLGISLEYAGYLWASNGAPVKVIYPKEGTYALMEGCAIIKGGPNPKAAEAYVDFINRKDVREKILATTFRRAARQDLDLAKLPGSMPAYAAIKMLAYDERRWTEARAATLDKIKDMILKTR